MSISHSNLKSFVLIGLYVILWSCNQEKSSTSPKPNIKNVSKIENNKLIRIIGRENLEIQLEKSTHLFSKLVYNDSLVQLKSFEKSNLIKSILSLVKKHNQPEPKSAFYRYEDDNFKIIPEEIGAKLDTIKLKSILETALSQGPKTYDLNAEGCYVNPIVKSNDKRLIEILPKLKQILALKLEYKFEDETLIVDRKTIGALVTTNEKGELKVDYNACFRFVSGLAKKYDVITSNITFKNYQNEIKSIAKSELGKRINVMAEMRRVTDAILHQKAFSAGPIMILNGVPSEMLTSNRNYIEVDLGHQKIFCYKRDTVFLSSDIVSGNVGAGMASPKGAFFIKYKETNTRLTGPGYSTHVNFWMPFYEGVGLHDALWRKQFGGTIYMGSGSHGCINLPYNIANSIFSNYPQGSVVICH